MFSVVIILAFLQINATFFKQAYISFKNYHHLPLCWRKRVADYGPRHVVIILNVVVEIYFLLLQHSTKSKQFDFAAVFLQHIFMLQATKILLKPYGGT